MIPFEKQFLMRFMNKKRILDIGCGSGFRTSRLAKPGLKVYGIDVSGENINKARSRYGDVIFKTMNSEEMGFPRDCFDKVYAIDVLEHVDNITKTLKETRRVLKVGGQFIVLVPAEKSEKWLLKLRPTFHKEIHHVRIFKNGELQNKMDKLGFDVTKKSQRDFLKHAELYYSFKTKNSSKSQLDIGSWDDSFLSMVMHALVSSFDPYWVFNTPIKYVPIWIITLPLGALINLFGNRIFPKSVYFEFVKRHRGGKKVQNIKDVYHERLVPDMVPWYHKQMYYDHIDRYNFAKKYVQGKKVLDVACGTGYGCVMLAEAGASSVVGIDNSKDTISYAKSRYSHKKVTYKVGDATQLKVRGDSFDTVVSFETLEHVRHYRKYLKEVVRVLKKDGEFIVSTPNKILATEEANPFHLKEFELKEFRKLMSSYFTEGVVLYGQKPIHLKYIKFVGSAIDRLPPGRFRWFIDTGLKIFFRGSKVLPLEKFKFGFTPSIFVVVCRKG